MERNHVFQCAWTTEAYLSGWLGGRVPQISGRGDSHAKVPPTFLTHSNAIAGFTSQSLGLPFLSSKIDF